MSLRHKSAAWWRKHFLYAGGAKRLRVSDVDPYELMLGINHEAEHSDDVEVQMKIAMDHLQKHPNKPGEPGYYTVLEEAEKSLRKRK